MGLIPSAIINFAILALVVFFIAKKILQEERVKKMIGRRGTDVKEIKVEEIIMEGENPVEPKENENGG